MTAPDQLKAFLKTGKLTRAEVAEDCGFDRSMLSHYMRGTRRPGRDAALALERVVGIPAEAWSPGFKKAS